MNIIITGGTKGIGRAISELLASKSANLAICSRSEEDLRSTKKALLEINADIQILSQVTDVSKVDQVKAFGEMVLKEWESVDVLINNAGVFLPGSIYNEDENNLPLQIETNLYSAYHLSRSILPNMIARKSGQIINICSIASQIAYPNGGSYSVSKFALLGMTKCLREELKEMGIRVTAILPGATWSDSWKGVTMPEDRLMQASDIAKVVFTAIDLSSSAVMEDIVLRPQLGDL